MQAVPDGRCSSIGTLYYNPTGDQVRARDDRQDQPARERARDHPRGLRHRCGAGLWGGRRGRPGLRGAAWRLRRAPSARGVLQGLGAEPLETQGLRSRGGPGLVSLLGRGPRAAARMLCSSAAGIGKRRTPLALRGVGCTGHSCVLPRQHDQSRVKGGGWGTWALPPMAADSWPCSVWV